MRMYRKVRKMLAANRSGVQKKGRQIFAANRSGVQKKGRKCRPPRATKNKPCSLARLVCCASYQPPDALSNARYENTPVCWFSSVPSESNSPTSVPCVIESVPYTLVLHKLCRSHNAVGMRNMIEVLYISRYKYSTARSCSVIKNLI